MGEWIYKKAFFCFVYFVCFYRATCQIECSEHCVPMQDSALPTCNTTTGTCLAGCVVGYTGDKCDIQCGENCVNCSWSSEFNGQICHKCKDSFYQRNGGCVPCSSTCLTNQSAPHPVCREADGTCEFGCLPTYFGLLCNKPCSATCSDKECHRETGACTKACSTDFVSGELCNKLCSDGCVGSKCQQNGECKQGCKVHTWGTSCNSTCSSGCANNTDSNIQQLCNVTDGQCLYGCIQGTWGTMCEYSCPQNCKTSSCSRSGECSDGCVSGFWGTMCESRCSLHCTNNSCFQTGECIYGCTTEKVHGNDCSSPCDVRCLNSSCERTSGECKGCATGYYGYGCTQSCPENCLQFECEEVLGNCTNGCRDGWYGSFCDQPCSSICLDNVCDRTSGACECKEGSTATQCTNSQQDDDSEDENGTNTVIISFVSLGVVLVVLFFCLSLYLVRKKL